MKVCIEFHRDSEYKPRGLGFIEATYGVRCSKSRTAWGREYEAEFPDGQEGHAFGFAEQVYKLKNPDIKKVICSAGGGH
jgi:hypothetical protein